MTLSEYARAIGVNASTVSRGVARGSIPVVVLADGRRMIDQAAANSARWKNSNISRGHGGRIDRSIRKQSMWKVKAETGYEPSTLAIINVLRTWWPEIMQKNMAVLGAAEIDQARACVALSNMTGYLATMVFEETRKVRDWRTVLQEEIHPTFTAKDIQAYYAQNVSDVENWLDTTAGQEMADLMLDAGMAAQR
ncbi:hypothetical protein [Mesorhizobium sp. B2-6-5]|uniref:hypothetical protein n=1 Tax=Mesorhizobium sp. B2-6-5 TaxID=2589912 RepID=UPI00116B7A4F|nr:hypothetical protein [Mesorhizobium sp. B2-6-5]TPJ34260.1 hypothetical protein FJ432_30010 [Mesorhizobium sp. B2-6-5]